MLRSTVDGRRILFSISSNGSHNGHGSLFVFAEDRTDGNTCQLDLRVCKLIAIETCGKTHGVIDVDVHGLVPVYV